MELAVLEGFFQTSDELAAKNSGQNFQREKKAIGCVNPGGVIEAQATGGNNAMDMGMQTELLTPSVQDTEKANFGAEVTGITTDFEEGFRVGEKLAARDLNGKALAAAGV